MAISFTIKSNTTAEGVREYFETCKAFWIRQGNPEGVATSKAFWWDCVEVWNADNKWNEAKKAFAKAFRNYEPFAPVPDETKVERGEV